MIAKLLSINYLLINYFFYEILWIYIRLEIKIHFKQCFDDNKIIVFNICTIYIIVLGPYELFFKSKSLYNIVF